MHKKIFLLLFFSISAILRNFSAQEEFLQSFGELTVLTVGTAITSGIFYYFYAGEIPEKYAWEYTELPIPKIADSLYHDKIFRQLPRYARNHIISVLQDSDRIEKHKIFNDLCTLKNAKDRTPFSLVPCKTTNKTVFGLTNLITPYTGEIIQYAPSNNIRIEIERR